MPSAFIYVAAAVAEIAGCFAFWAWLRLAKSALWLIPGCAALVAFAYLLTRVDAAAAGRAYAAYGGIYIAVALLWLWLRRESARIAGIWAAPRCACSAPPSSSSARTAARSADG